MNSIDYLLKPIDYQELVFAIEKFKKLQKPANGNVLYPDMLNQMMREFNRSYKKRFIVKFGDHIQFKPVEEIAYIYAEGKLVYIVLQENNRRYIIDHTLEELENGLLDPACFFRINRKFIVHIEAVTDVRNFANGRLKVKCNTPSEQDMIVSREKVNDFKDWLNQ